MSPAKLTTWTGSLHQTFRLLPVNDQSRNLKPFLESDGETPDALLLRLPYDVARAQARGSQRTTPHPKRYRDGKQVYQTVGLLYEDESHTIRLTDLGFATLRWLTIITENNSVILARHSAYALAACQLRNPTGAGRRFDDSLEVFPFRFIWTAMLALDGKISSEELNRALFKVKNEDDLDTAIEAIAAAREASDLSLLGPEVVTGKAKNDRIIPWMSLASFGWTLFPDKREREGSTYYELIPRTIDIVKQAAHWRRKHRDFSSVSEYVEHISASAVLPEDLR